VTIARSAEAGETLKRATDLTNELLTANADALRTSTQTIRTQPDDFSMSRVERCEFEFFVEQQKQQQDRGDFRKILHYSPSNFPTPDRITDTTAQAI